MIMAFASVGSAWRGRPPAVPGRWSPARRARRRCRAAAAGRWTPPPGGGQLAGSWSARVAVGVAGGVAALQPGLVHPQPAEVLAVGEKPRVRSKPTAVQLGVQLG